MNFEVNVDVKTTGKEQIDALERQLNALKSETVKINVELDNKNLNSKNFNTKSFSKRLQDSINKSIKTVKFKSSDDGNFYEQHFKQIKKLNEEAKKVAKDYKESINGTGSDDIDKSALKAAKAKISYDKKIELARKKQAVKQAEQSAKTIEKARNKVLNGTYESKSSTMKNRLDTYEGLDSNLVKKAQQEAELYNNTLSKLRDHFDTNKAFTLNDKEIVSSFNNMTLSAERFDNIMTQIRNTESKPLITGVAERSANDVKKYYEDNSKAIKKYGVELKALENEYRNARTVADKARIDNEFKNLKSAISTEGLTGKSLFAELKRGFGQIGQFAVTYGAIQQIPNVLRNMATEVLNIDTAITELRKVSDVNDNQLSNYFDHAAESAKKYGSEIHDVISSAADWKRLGYSFDESGKLADVTTLLQRVGDNMTQESSASGLISTLKGFGKDSDEAKSIVDMVNEVANTQPIDTAGLFAGLERSSSSMKAANNTLEQTIGLITAANSVVQDPDSVGTAFKTISMRIRGATTELEEAGLDMDGMAESTAKLQEEIMALSGIDIMENKDTFKSTYDILDELSSKWQDLTDIQQASITELIAGKRQGNLVSALMTNFDIARESVETAKNSEGSAEKELSNYQKSMQYSIDTFKAQFQELSNSALTSDFLKNAIDSGTGLLNVLTQIIDVGGGIPTLLTAIGGVKLFKNLDLFY